MKVDEDTYTFNYRFISRNDIYDRGPLEVEFMYGKGSSDQITEEAYEQLSNLLGESLKQVKKTYKVKRVSSRFTDPPWGDNWKALEAAIMSIDGVRSMRYEDPYEGAYRAPRYHIRTTPGKEADVITEIKNYFSPLIVKKNGGSRLEMIVTSVPNSTVN